METYPSNIPQPTNQQKINTDNNKSIVVFITIAFTFLLLGLIIGYLIGNKITLNTLINNQSSSYKTTPTTFLFPTQSPIQEQKVLELNNSNNFEKPTDIILEICGENWEKISDNNHELLCLSFYNWGRIDKTIDGKLINTNSSSSSEMQKQISEGIDSIYNELLSEKFKKWLSVVKAPSVGGTMPVIKLYQKSKTVIPVSEQFLVTHYIWGTNYSTESQRLEEIFEQLKKFSTEIN